MFGFRALGEKDPIRHEETTTDCLRSVTSPTSPMEAFKEYLDTAWRQATNFATSWKTIDFDINSWITQIQENPAFLEAVGLTALIGILTLIFLIFGSSSFINERLLDFEQCFGIGERKRATTSLLWDPPILEKQLFSLK